MSKAFVKDIADEREADANSEPSLSLGEKNYMTPGGANRMKAELQDLLYQQRPEITAVVAWAAGNGDRSENADYIYGKRRLRELDRRIRFLSKRLEIAEIIDPREVKSDQVLFGATVTVEDAEGERKSYSIVGVDEADPGKGKISWISPLTRALLKARVGDIVQFSSPGGSRELEVIEIVYREIF